MDWQEVADVLGDADAIIGLCPSQQFDVGHASQLGFAGFDTRRDRHDGEASELELLGYVQRIMLVENELHTPRSISSGSFTDYATANDGC
jgi:hypothetical protein